MTRRELRERAEALGYSYEDISKLSGVPAETVKKILGGITKSPEYEILKMLEEVLEVKEDYTSSSEMRDQSVAYSVSKRQGEYTIEDYFAWPEGERVELIDGVIYNMAAPRDLHQLICDEIYWKIRNYIEKSRGKCIVVTSPIDVQLDCDDKTMVQPDVMIICDRDKFKNGRIFGAPDLVVEVLSPSTRRKDMYLKLEKYINAGVREYWIVDPDKKRVCAYEFEKDEFVSIYSFEHKVPIGIFENKCEVDFSEIYSYVSFLYEESLS